MRPRRWVGTLFVYLNLELAALLGVPVRPEEVSEVTRLLTQTQVTRVEQEGADGDPRERRAD